jgi:hypothetical protein
MKNNPLFSVSVRLGLVIATCLPLMSCFHLNHFASEATDFNGQVAAAQDQTLLLNVIRAANRFPMHFTELSTLSGTGTLTAGGTLTVPFATLNGGMGTFSAAPTAMVTETPTFNIAVLETQEFYRGMLSPISQEQIGTYYEEGLQPELVWTLMFGQIAFQPSPTAKMIVIENNFHPLKDDNKVLIEKDGTKKNLCPTGSASEYECFKAVIRALVDRHLATEQVKETSNLGPALSQNAFDNLKWLSGYDPKAIKIASISKEDCKAINEGSKDKKNPKDPKDSKESCEDVVKGLPSDQQKLFLEGTTLYRLQRDTTDTRFCFDEGLQNGEASVDSKDIPSIIRSVKIPYKLLCKSRLPKNYKPTENEEKQGVPVTLLFNFGGADAKSQNETGPSIQVRPRSTEGIIYYLGEIARCSLNLDKKSPCPQKVKIVDLSHSGSENTLFDMEDLGDPKTKVANTRILVDWEKNHYQVNMDPSGTDRSGQVLRILTQLLALNRSAKDFPTPSIVPIISH